MQSSLRSFAGPRIKYTPQDSALRDDHRRQADADHRRARSAASICRSRSATASMDEIHRALAENCVIFFRDQHLSQDQHLASAACSATCTSIPAAPPEPGQPELMIIHADKDSPRANGEGWHTDVSLRPRAADGQHPLHQEMPAQAAATRCSPTCTPPTRRCRTA